MDDLAALNDRIRDYFGDTSRPPQATKDGLEEIAELAAELAATIDAEDDDK